MKHVHTSPALANETNLQRHAYPPAMTLVRVGAAVLALGFGTMACGQSRTIDGYDEREYAVSEDAFLGNVTMANMDVSRGMLTGDMGPVRGFAQAATVKGYEEEGFAQIDLMSTGDDGSAMQALTIFGDLGTLSPGDEMIFRRDASEGALSVEAIICSGQESPGLWSFDEDAEQVTVIVSETDNIDTQEVEFVTVSEDGDVAAGSLVMAR